jgi:GNAT superfamily N-acetyltransferase
VSPNRDFRLAGPPDARAIAALHADSWRRHYRGAYSDAFLDGDVAADRLAVWTDRLGRRDPGSCTILAEDESGLIGFAHTVFDENPTWGALLDNIHVVHPHQRHGVGSGLLAQTAKAVAGRAQQTGLYLWVLEQNVDAQAFYEARRAQRVERAQAVPPGGVPGRLNGSPHKLRYAWDDPSVLEARGRSLARGSRARGILEGTA